jgi:hypothetical protein
MTWYQYIALVICCPVVVWQLITITDYFRGRGGIAPLHVIFMCLALSGLSMAFLGFR